MGTHSWEKLRDYSGKIRKYQAEYGPESIARHHRDREKHLAPLVPKLGYTGIRHPKYYVCSSAASPVMPPSAHFSQSTQGRFAVADCSQMFPERFDNPNWKVPACIVIWGNNPVVSNPDSFMGYWIIECMKRGTKLIVVDPRLTWLAHGLNYGFSSGLEPTAALALAMLNIIIEEELYDKEFVEKWTSGFDRLRERARQYPPEKVEEITWVPKEKIVAAARLYATSKPAAIQWGVY